MKAGRITWLVGLEVLLPPWARGEAQNQACHNFVIEADAANISSASCQRVRALRRATLDDTTCAGADSLAVGRIGLELREREAIACWAVKLVASPQPTSEVVEPAKTVRPTDASTRKTAGSSDTPRHKGGRLPIAKASVEIDVQALLRDARDHLEHASQQYEQARKACSDTKPCADELRKQRHEFMRERTLAISVYLRLAVRWAGDLHDVSRLIELNLSGDDPVTTAEALNSAIRSGIDKRAILAAAEILKADDEATRTKLAARLMVLRDPNYAKLVDALQAEKPSREKVAELLRLLAPEQLIEIYRAVGDVGRMIAAARALAERPMVVLLSPRRANTCRGKDNVLLALEALLKGPGEIRQPVYVEPKDFETAVRWTRCRCLRSPDCGESPMPELSNVGAGAGSCQAVLAVQASDEPTGPQVVADVEVVLPNGARAPGIPLKSRFGSKFPEGCDATATLAQEQAANEIALWLAGRFDYLSGLPRLEPAERTVLVPSASLDVHVQGVRATTADLSGLRGKGLSIEDRCDDPTFNSELQRVLTVEEKVIGRVSKEPETPDQPKLSLRQDGRRTCAARLEQNGETLLALSGVVSDAPWKEAGAGVGNALLKYYEPNRPLPPEASKWATAARSLILSGLPQLSDDNRANNVLGWVLASTDLALLSGGVATFAASIQQRSAYSTSGDSRQLEHANSCLHVGTKLLIGVLVERVITGLGYGIGWLDRGRSPSRQASTPGAQ